MDNTRITTGSLYSTPYQPAEPPAKPEPEPNDRQSVIHRMAGYISATFSPLLLPSYAMIIAMWTTRLSSAPEGARLSSTVVILLLTCFLPLFALLGAIRLGKITDSKVRSRRQRVFLYPVAITAYLLCALYLAKVHAPQWLVHFFIGVCISSAGAFAINFKWKISAHATACGGLLAFMFYIEATSLSNLFFLPWLSAAIIITGAVATSRLILQAHTLAQTIAGTILGMLGVGIAMLLA